MANKIVCNIKTGQVSDVELSQEELDQKSADEARKIAKYDTYDAKRRAAYAESLDPFMKEAVADFLLENDSTKLDALKVVRTNIKALFPKP